MKLLIVDDEELTREGLIASLDWEMLGINEIFQAEDGIAGLHIARTQKPDIILCDVRMPRMDGIQMIERLEELLPDTAVIFMSGYSDKEYLKAAIKLKAVNYVEKPLNPLEIQDAIGEAKKQFQQKLRTRQNETLHSMETAARLALLLTRPYERGCAQITALTAELSLNLTSDSSFTTFIVNLDQSDPDSTVTDSIRQNLEIFLAHYHLRAFYVSKHTQYQIFHVLAPTKPTESLLDRIGTFLSAQFTPISAFFIARGDTVVDISKVYQSYTSSVALMQNSFFFDSGQILVPYSKHVAPDVFPPILPAIPAATFAKSLLAKDAPGCTLFLEQLFSFYDKNRNAFAIQAKDLYYKLFMTLQDSRQKLKLPSDVNITNDAETLTEYLSHCFTFKELHTALLTGTEHFFNSIKCYEPEDATIFQIKNYINKCYFNESLSVKDIGSHVFLSASYVCTYFKNETGQTLNQYLTDCRMEKAKLLLLDPQYQITDVSSKVGYSNGNYFSKSFKKSIGLSPSEYREKMLR